MAFQAYAAKIRSHHENMSANFQKDGEELTGIALCSGLKNCNDYTVGSEKKIGKRK